MHKHVFRYAYLYSWKMFCQSGHLARATHTHTHDFFHYYIFSALTTCFAMSAARSCRCCASAFHAAKHTLHFCFPLALSGFFCVLRHCLNCSLSPLNVHPGALHVHWFKFWGALDDVLHKRQTCELLFPIRCRAFYVATLRLT